MTPWNRHADPPEPLSKPWLRLLGFAMVASALVSLVIYPVSWQLILLYICIGIVVGFLGLLDELPRLLGFIIVIVVVYMGQNLMLSIAPQWHSTGWQPGLIVAGAMFAVLLVAFFRQRLA